MPGVMDNLSKINSFIRTLLASIVVGVIGVGSYFGYQTYNASNLNIDGNNTLELLLAP